MPQDKILAAKGLIMLFFFVVYMVGSFILMRRLFNWRSRKREEYRQAAIQNGRQVTAYLKRYKTFSSESHRAKRGGGGTGYKAYYYYFVFPGGKRYSLRFVLYDTTPPTEITLYLHPSNPRKFYTEYEMTRGKGNALLIGLVYLGGFALLGLMGKFIL